MKKRLNRAPAAVLTILLALTLSIGTLSGCSKKEKKPEDMESSSSQSESSSEGENIAEPDGALDSSSEDESTSSEESSASSSSSSALSSSSGAASSMPAGTGSSSQVASSKPPATSQSKKPPATSSAPSTSSSQASNVSSSVQKYNNVIYAKQGAYIKTETFQDATIRIGGVKLENKTFKGDVTITSKAGNGGVTFENVKVEGTLTVEGGGSVKLYDTTAGKLLVDSDGVQVTAYKKSDVGPVTVKNDATLTESGLAKEYDGFKEITVSGSGITNLTLKGVEASKLTTRSRARVSSDKNTTISKCYAQSATYLSGRGAIRELIARHDEVYYEYRPGSVKTEDGADKPTQRDPSDISWGDADDESYDKNREDVTIRSISDRTLQVGEKKAVSVDTNARTIQATTSNKDVVTVTEEEGEDLVLRARGVGTARVTVIGSRSGYNSDKVTFAVTVTTDPNEAPRITNISGNPAQWTNKDATITFTVTDEDLASVTANGVTSTVVSSSYSFTVSRNGDYPIVAKDRKGNTSTESVQVNRIDKTAPVIEDLIASGLLVTFRVADEQSGVAAADVLIRSSTGATVTPVVQNGVYSFTGENGRNYTISATDQAKNVSLQRNVSTVGTVPAKDPPRFASAPTVAGAGEVRVITFTLTYPQAAKPAVSAAPALAISEAASTPSSDGYMSTIYTATVQGAEGDFVFTAANANGSVQATVSVDAKNPVISTPQVDNTTLAPQKPVTFTVTDGGSGLGSAAVRVSPAEGVSREGNNYQFIATRSTVYTITAQDQAGNASTQTVEVQGIGVPAVPVIGDETVTTGSAAGSVLVSFPVTDNNPPLTVKGPSGETLTVQNGLYSFTVTQNGTYRVTAANRTGTAERTFAISTIVTAPVIEKPVLTPSGATVGPVNVSFTVRGAQPDELTVLFGGQTLAAVNGVYSFSAPTNGDYSVTARNSAGVQVSETFRVANIEPLGIGTVTVEQEGVWTKQKKVSFSLSPDDAASKAAVTIGYSGKTESIGPSGSDYAFTAQGAGDYTITAQIVGGAPVTKMVTIQKIDTALPAAPALSLSDGQTLIGQNDAAERAAGDFILVGSTAETASASAETFYYMLSNPSVTIVGYNQSAFVAVPKSAAKGDYRLTLKPGTNTVTLKSVDAAGNASVAKVYIIKVAASKS